MRRFALRAVRDEEGARELTQDALLVAVANGPTFAGRSTVRTWVLGILSHKIIDHLRERGAALEGSDDAAMLETPSSADVERTAMARQELGRVEVALARLPARERVALLLTDVEGVDREEVCHVLSVTPTHLRVLLHRGRNRLRRLL